MNEQYCTNEDVYAVYDNELQLAYVGDCYEEAIQEYQKCIQDLKESIQDTVQGHEQVMLLKVLRDFHVREEPMEADPDYLTYGFEEIVYEDKGDERDGNKGQ
ncbi:hypothetical protein ABNF65_16225 [Paenibacillus larvae]